MKTMIAAFAWLSDWARIVLVIGLLVGIALPDVAEFVRGHIAELLVLLLFFAALRIGPKAALGRVERFGPLFCLILFYQVAMPIAAILAFAAWGWQGMVPSAIILMLAAAPISGSPNLTVMVGGDPAPSLRLLVLTTSLLPITVVPVFYFSPLFGSPDQVFHAALRLLGIIALSCTVAFTIRHFFMKELEGERLKAVDGVSAFLMAVLVVGLMSAFGPMLFTQPWVLAGVMGVTFSVNIGLQMVARSVLTKWSEPGERTAYAVGAGNRNMALFLAALPASVTDPLLVYVACYQIPMYLTPYILGRFYRWLDSK